MTYQRRTESAFTIVELLVAAAITILIVVMLGTIFGSLINTSGRASQRIDAFRDARAALQLMRRDFEALVKAQPAPYFQIDVDLAGPDIRQLYGLIAAKNQPAGNPAPIAGDLCAVRYYSAWDGRGYVLHRYFRDSDLTLKSFQGHLAGGVLGYTTTGDLYYNSGASDDAIATYAWNLQIIAYDSAGNVINPVQDINNHDTTGAPYICDPSAIVTNPLPDSIELSFKALSADAARTVIAATAGRSDAYEVWKVVDNKTPSSGDQTLYDNLIKPYAQDFRTRIHLK